MFHYQFVFLATTLLKVVNGVWTGTTTSPECASSSMKRQIDIGNRENFCDYRLLDMFESYQQLLSSHLFILSGSREFNAQELVMLFTSQLTNSIKCGDVVGSPLLTLPDDEELRLPRNEKVHPIVDVLEFTVDCLLERANKSGAVNSRINQNTLKDLNFLENVNPRQSAGDENPNRRWPNCLKCYTSQECKECEERRRKLIQLFRLYAQIINNDNAKYPRRRRKRFNKLFMIFMHLSLMLVYV